jgi:hypothetical protein
MSPDSAEPFSDDGPSDLSRLEGPLEDEASLKDGEAKAKKIKDMLSRHPDAVKCITDQLESCEWGFRPPKSSSGNATGSGSASVSSIARPAGRKANGGGGMARMGLYHDETVHLQLDLMVGSADSGVIASIDGMPDSEFIKNPLDFWLYQPVRPEEIFLKDIGAGKISMMNSKMESESLAMGKQNAALKKKYQAVVPIQRSLALTEYMTDRDGELLIQHLKVDGQPTRYLDILNLLQSLNIANNRPAAEIKLPADWLLIGPFRLVTQAGQLWLQENPALVSDTGSPYLVDKYSAKNPRVALRDLYSIQYPWSRSRARVVRLDGTRHLLCWPCFRRFGPAEETQPSSSADGLKVAPPTGGGDGSWYFDELLRRQQHTSGDSGPLFGFDEWDVSVAGGMTTGGAYAESAASRGLHLPEVLPGTLAGGPLRDPIAPQLRQQAPGEPAYVLLPSNTSVPGTD